MRILVDYRPALRQRTGVGEYVHQLARAFTSAAAPDDALTLFSSSWKDRLDPQTIPGARVIDRRVPVRLLNALWHRAEWPSIESLTGESFDVAQSLHPLLLPATHAAQAVMVHDLDFLDHPERTSREIRRDYGALAPSHAARADRILVNSEWTGAEVSRRLGILPSKITVAAPGAPDWPRRTSEPADGTVLFLGTLEPRKNLDVLLDAYARLAARQPAVPRLVLAGAPPRSRAALHLMTRALDPSMKGRVQLTGYVSDPARLDVFRQALALVMPSHLEGFGMPVLEAMTVGVPVIVSNRGALPEVAGPAGRFVEANDPEAWATAIEEVVSNRELRDRMREAGWQQAARFSWASTAARARDGWAAAIEARRSRGA